MYGKDPVHENLVLHGHIIAAIAGTSTGYVVPISNVCKEAKARTKVSLQLPSEYYDEQVLVSGAKVPTEKAQAQAQPALRLDEGKAAEILILLQDRLFEEQQRADQILAASPRYAHIQPVAANTDQNLPKPHELSHQNRLGLKRHSKKPARTSSVASRLKHNSSSRRFKQEPCSHNSCNNRGPQGDSPRTSKIGKRTEASGLSARSSLRKRQADFANRRSLSLTTLDDYSNDTIFDDAVEYFIEDADSSRGCRPRAKLLRRFFGSVDMGHLRCAAGDRNRTSLLLQGVRTGSTWALKAKNGLLDAQQLYMALRHVPARVENSPTGLDCAEKEALSHEEVMSVSESRNTAMVYITDLDPLTALALVASAGQSQTQPLRNALCRHLAREAYMGGATGFRTFELAFNLPFMAMRCLENIDYGGSVDALDMSFLDENADARHHLNSASYSCTIVGRDSWNWRGYCFIDTNFDGTDRETSQDYYDEMETCGMPIDPCSNGKCTTEGSDLDPQKVFLRVLIARLNMINDEWNLVINALQSSMDNHSKVRANLIH